MANIIHTELNQWSFTPVLFRQKCIQAKLEYFVLKSWPENGEFDLKVNSLDIFIQVMDNFSICMTNEPYISKLTLYCFLERFVEYHGWIFIIWWSWKKWLCFPFTIIIVITTWGLENRDPKFQGSKPCDLPCHWTEACYGVNRVILLTSFLFSCPGQFKVLLGWFFSECIVWQYDISSLLIFFTKVTWPWSVLLNEECTIKKLIVDYPWLG